MGLLEWECSATRATEKSDTIKAHTKQLKDINTKMAFKIANLIVTL
jgi:hypothetical protein